MLETLEGPVAPERKDPRDHRGLTSNLRKVCLDRGVPKENQETQDHQDLMGTPVRLDLWGTGALPVSPGLLVRWDSPDLVASPSRVNQEKTAFPACPETGDARDPRAPRDPLERGVSRVSTSWDPPERTEGPDETEGLGYRESAVIPENQERRAPPAGECAGSAPWVPWAFRENRETPAPPDDPDATARTASPDPEETTAAPALPERPGSVATAERTADQARTARRDSLEVWAHQEPREKLVTKEGLVFKASLVFLDQTASTV